MQVGGKTVSGKFSCFLCKDHGKDTPAVGFCIQCDDFICHTCFENHKKWKLAKQHTLESSDNETKGKYECIDDFDVCDKHDKETIKFFCPSHEFVGCGDCMVLEHKPCSVEYVRDKAKVFKDSQDFKQLVKGISENLEEVHLLEFSVKLNKTQIKDINNKFVEDVETFKDEIISNVKKQSDEMVKEAEIIKVENTKQMDFLAEECGRVSKDISTLTQTVDMLTDKPNKLFVSSLQFKKTMEDIHDQLEEMKGKNVIENYHFERDRHIECTKLGSLHKDERSGQEEACKNEQINEEACKNEQINEEACKNEQINEEACKNEQINEEAFVMEHLYSDKPVFQGNPKKRHKRRSRYREKTKVVVSCDICYLVLDIFQQINQDGYGEYEGNEYLPEKWFMCESCGSRVHVQCIDDDCCPICTTQLI